MTKLASIRGGDQAQNAEIAKQMLEVSIADIEQLPDYVKLQPGKYLIDEVVSAVIEDNPDHGVAIKVSMAVASVIELAKYPNVSAEDLPAEEVPAPGSIVSFSFTGALGIQQFIKAFGKLVEGSEQEVSIPQMVEALAYNQYGTLAIVTSLRSSRDTKEIDPVTGAEVPKTYMSLQAVVGM